MEFVEELNQLITKHLVPKANLFDYSDAVEALLEAGHRLRERVRRLGGCECPFGLIREVAC